MLYLHEAADMSGEIGFDGIYGVLYGWGPVGAKS